MEHQEEKRELSVGEWNVMESLWGGSPKIGSQIVQDLKESVGWNRSTTLTMLRRMTEKGLIACEENEGIKSYRPLLDREVAARRESENFLKRVYHGNVNWLISSFVEKQKLSREEIAELYDILKKAEESQDD